MSVSPVRKRFAIAEKIFQDDKDIPLQQRESHKLYFGRIVVPNTREVLDEVMLAVFKSPHTYTGEDLIEIQAHGGMLIVSRILQLILLTGARMAEPGEFTKRAFLNRKMDLAQAEAVADLIHAQTELAQKFALRQLEGELSREINSISSTLLDLLAELEAHIDFPEEELPQHTYDTILQTVTALKIRIAQELSSLRFGKAIREGVQVAIIGKPNVGKSSLLNRLLNEPRAIVTHLPGTTRDTITESINIDGIPFVFTDTAGIRDTLDLVEQEGVRRTKETIFRSDLVLLILDHSQALDTEDQSVLVTLKHLPEIKSRKIKLIILLNKSDLGEAFDSASLQKHLPESDYISISALTGMGIDTLKQQLVASVKTDGMQDSSSGLVITNIRHAELLEKTVADIDHIQASIHKTNPPELIALDLREALLHLGEITGENITDDLLNRIFSRFCIGK